MTLTQHWPKRKKTISIGSMSCPVKWSKPMPWFGVNTQTFQQVFPLVSNSTTPWDHPCLRCHQPPPTLGLPPALGLCLLVLFLNTRSHKNEPMASLCAFLATNTISYLLVQQQDWLTIGADGYLKRNSMERPANKKTGFNTSEG